ncbi:MAG: carboxyl transferase domain-containing protein [Anaerolineae bacterium]
MKHRRHWVPGRIFYNQARMSAKGIPQIAVVMGSCTAGGAYIPAMSDETIIVKGTGTIFSGWSAVGQGSDGRGRQRGGIGAARKCIRAILAWRIIWRRTTITLELCRGIVAMLNTRKRITLEVSKREAPTYDPQELYGILPRSFRESYDVREVIARLADGSRSCEFKALYGTTLVCGFARIEGYPVGIVVNNGVLFSELSLKGAHFRVVYRTRIPLLFLQNITDSAGQRIRIGRHR